MEGNDVQLLWLKKWLNSRQIIIAYCDNISIAMDYLYQKDRSSLHAWSGNNNGSADYSLAASNDSAGKCSMDTHSLHNHLTHCL
jgi:hypothetical protein